LLSHIYALHRNSETFECHAEDNCSRKYYDFSSFRKHRYSKHLENPDSNYEDPGHLDNPVNIEEMRDYSQNDDVEMYDDDCGPHEANDVWNASKLFEESINFDLLVILSELYSIKDVSRKRVLDIIRIFSKNLLEGEAFKLLKLSVVNALEHHSNEFLPKIEGFFDSFSNIFKPSICKKKC